MSDAQIDRLFAGKPATRAIYDRLTAKLRAAGPFAVEPKKTCLHLVNGSAFLGVHPRKDSILLTIRSETAIRSKRVRKVDQVSAKRFHNDLVVSSPAEVDAELVVWLRSAYAISGSKK